MCALSEAFGAFHRHSHVHTYASHGWDQQLRANCGILQLHWWYFNSQLLLNSIIVPCMAYSDCCTWFLQRSWASLHGGSATLAVLYKLIDALASNMQPPALTTCLAEQIAQLHCSLSTENNF
jgi:hypothetical protein